MFNIAIVEDALSDAERMKGHIEKWGSAEGEDAQVSVYNCSRDFVAYFKSQYDIIFLDIMLPDRTGIETAKLIRKKDEAVIIVFTTSMKQYAINGYEVNALDFILKPVGYNRFAALMRKCRARVQYNTNNIVCRVPGSTYNINVDDIVYIESRGHMVIYNMRNGQTIEKRTTLTEVEKLLPTAQFSRCGVSFLVNLKHVKCIEGDYAILGNTKLKLTRSKNREFRKAFVDFYSM